jgi:hypothetical protein
MSEANPSSDHFSEPASTNVALQKALQGHDDLLDSIPIIPAILQSLLAELNQPAEQVNVLRVAELVGRDESLAAQCLRMQFAAIWPRNAYRYHARRSTDLGHSPYSGYCRHQFDDANGIGATGGGPTGLLGALTGLRDFESEARPLRRVR